MEGKKDKNISIEKIWDYLILGVSFLTLSISIMIEFSGNINLAVFVIIIGFIVSHALWLLKIIYRRMLYKKYFPPSRKKIEKKSFKVLK